MMIAITPRASLRRITFCHLQPDLESERETRRRTEIRKIDDDDDDDACARKIIASQFAHLSFRLWLHRP